MSLTAGCLKSVANRHESLASQLLEREDVTVRSIGPDAESY